MRVEPIGEASIGKSWKSMLGRSRGMRAQIGLGSPRLEIEKQMISIVEPETKDKVYIQPND